MSQLNFWSIATGYDVKYLLPVGIDKQIFALTVINDHYQAVVITKQFSMNIKAGCTRHASCAFFVRMRLISRRHVLY